MTNVEWLLHGFEGLKFEWKLLGNTINQIKKQARFGLFKARCDISKIWSLYWLNSKNLKLNISSSVSAGTNSNKLSEFTRHNFLIPRFLTPLSEINLRFTSKINFF